MSSTYYADAMEIKADLVKFMQDIIRIPSLSSEEGAVVERARQEMLRIGYDEVTVDPMGNLLGRIGNGPRVIAFDGHIDTVDVGDPELWDRDPHSGDAKEPRYRREPAGRRDRREPAGDAARTGQLEGG